MKSAVTVSAVEQAKGGPFVLWDTFPNACSIARRIGFDGIEVFAPDAEFFRQPTFQSALDGCGLELAAAGTGAGWVAHKLQLSDSDPTRRQAAIDFVRTIIDAVAPWKTKVIIGSMQGRAEAGEQSSDRRSVLCDALAVLCEYAASAAVQLLIEPLNRYETNLINTVEDGLKVIDRTGASNLHLLCDVFHMNIEEASVERSLETAGDHLGHVHFADSNRWAVGFGHINYAPIVQALRNAKYDGYLSAEVFAKPDSEAAAKQSYLAFQSLITHDTAHQLP